MLSRLKMNVLLAVPIAILATSPVLAQGCAKSKLRIIARTGAKSVVKAAPRGAKTPCCAECMPGCCPECPIGCCPEGAPGQGVGCKERAKGGCHTATQIVIGKDDCCAECCPGRTRVPGI